MSREVQVRFCERRGVRFPPPTLLYLESSFLMMAQGLEVFHRTKYSTATMIPQDEYTGLYEKLLAETPKRRRWLIEPRLKRGNEPFFKRRLVDLIEFAGDGFTDLAGTPDTWAGRVKDARNDLTHWSADRSGVEPGTDTFFQLLREATLLTKAVLLREIGFSTSECSRFWVTAPRPCSPMSCRGGIVHTCRPNGRLAPPCGRGAVTYDLPHQNARQGQ